MLAARVTGLLLFWGIWLLVPLMVDGVIALVQLLGISLGQRAHRRRVTAGLQRFPLVTVVIPVHNNARTLGRALRSVAGQTYPAEALEIICVDNGSSDNCFEVFCHCQEQYPGLRFAWISVERPGKAAALNAGIHASTGAYIMAVDADVHLAPDAVYEMVRHFESRPRLAAATGAIVVAPVKRETSRFMGLLHACEAFEYLSAFRVGRRHQSLRNTLYTLSGAFSAFRRDILLENSYLYDSQTVSEDTKITFDLRKRVKTRRPRATIECIDTAVAFVDPIPSLAALYSQRLRWQRGQIEVTALHSDQQTGITGPFRDVSGRTLLTDHTLAFPRLVWTFLLPFLFLLGYSPVVVASAVLAMYVAYAVIEGLFYLSAYRHVGTTERERLRRTAWVILLMPLFRFVVYWFRLAGILHAVAEPQRWHTAPLARNREPRAGGGRGPVRRKSTPRTAVDGS